MSMRILALTAALTVGLGSTAMAQGVMVDESGPEIYSEGTIVVPTAPFSGRADLYVDEDNTGVSDKIEDDMYENQNAITNGN